MYEDGAEPTQEQIDCFIERMDSAEEVEGGPDVHCAYALSNNHNYLVWNDERVSSVSIGWRGEGVALYCI